MVYLLRGEMGAGKTHWVKNALPQYDVTSPTFSIINQYADNLYHMDLYRLERDSDFLHLGLWEILMDRGNTVYIEWPERLPKRYIDLIKGGEYQEISIASRHR